MFEPSIQVNFAEPDRRFPAEPKPTCVEASVAPVVLIVTFPVELDTEMFVPAMIEFTPDVAAENCVNTRAVEPRVIGSSVVRTKPVFPFTVPEVTNVNIPEVTSPVDGELSASEERVQAPAATM